MRKITALLAVALLVGCREQPAATSHGRYQIVKGAHPRNGTVLLDTDTGRAWELNYLIDEGSPILIPIPIVDEEALLRINGETLTDYNLRRGNDLKRSLVEHRKKEAAVEEQKKKAESEADWVDVK